MDRKAWIVVSICSILLVLNLWMNGQNTAKQREADAKKAAEEQALQPVGEDKPGLVVEPKSDKKPIGISGEKKSKSLETEDTLFSLSTLSGGIEHAEFKKELSVYDSELNVRMNDQGLNRIGELTTLAGEVLDKQYYFIDDASTGDSSVGFFGKLKNGLGVKKTWSKVPGDEEGSSYRLRLVLELINDTAGAIPLGSIAMSTGSAAPLYENERPNYQTFFWQENGEFDSEDVSWFKGGMFWGKPKTEYRELKPDGVDFAGVENQFFATIVDPAETYAATVRAYPKEAELPASRGGFKGKFVNTYLTLPDELLEANKTRQLVFDVFVGPKKNSLLRSLEGGKEEVMNYGFWFGWISNILNLILNGLASLFGSPNSSWAWGWAVIALTIVIRIFMWPLHAKSTRTMKRMSKLQPKMAALKEKHSDDPNKMNQETMKLYREFGVNPMGGCLPLLVQIPVFFGFFTMLQYAVELRNQPFLGWVTDLSQPDTVAHVAGIPINVLPVLMAITMVLQMKMTPQTGDKMQRRIFMFMPIIFFFFCYNFASALALYWTTQNIFSIGQTWLMQKMPEPELKKGKKAGKKSWMQKLAERAEEAQKMQKQGKRPQAPSQQTEKPKKARGPKTGG